MLSQNKRIGMFISIPKGMIIDLEIRKSIILTNVPTIYKFFTFSTIEFQYINNIAQGLAKWESKQN